MPATDRGRARGALLTCLVAACAPTSAPMTLAQVREIVIGRTTRAELVTALGPPAETRDDTLIWSESRRPWLGPARTRQLTIRLDAAGRVKTYELESDFPGDSTEPESGIAVKPDRPSGD